MPFRSCSLNSYTGRCEFLRVLTRFPSAFPQKYYFYPVRKPQDIINYGPSAVLLQWENRIDIHINRSVHAYAQAAKTQPALVDIVPAYASLLLHFDPKKISAYQLKEWVYDLVVAPWNNKKAITHQLPVVYGGAFGPDMEAVSKALQLSEADIIALHTATTYHVFQLGYQPGFAFLGLTDSRLSVERLRTPRTKVPAGSVGLAGRQTAVYPHQAPGGWQLIGRCPTPLWQADTPPYARLQPGDQVAFYAIPPEQWAQEYPL